MRITATPPPSQSVLEVSRNTRAKHFENRVDLTEVIERRDTYESRNPSSRIENIMYDQNGNLLNLSDEAKAKDGIYISDEGELQQVGGEVGGLFAHTKEGEALWRLSEEVSGEYVKRFMRTKIDLANQIRQEFGLNSVTGGEGLEEIFDIYDKQFGTNSKKQLDELKQLRRVSYMLSSMNDALKVAFRNGEDSDSIMDYSDGSFSRADFDYVMGMANSFDYFGSREVTDKSTVNTTDPNVNSDLKDIAMDLFG